jgi:hypothetical protein
MNQEQVKARLLELDDTSPDFTLLFSGKSSRKVDGLYKPEEKEIIIHNKNHADDNQLMYTAIHEFAHHVHFSTSAKVTTSRSHTIDFWNIFHKLLFKAEETGIYSSIFSKDDRFVKLTKMIKEKYLAFNGSLMKEFGDLLKQAYALCLETRSSFDDYVDRVLQLHRTAAKTIMKVHELDINPNIGYENMKFVARIKDEGERREAEKAFDDGMTPDMAKVEFGRPNPPKDKLDELVHEKERLERQLEIITVRLAKVEKKIEEAKQRI